MTERRRCKVDCKRWAVQGSDVCRYHGGNHTSVYLDGSRIAAVMRTQALSYRRRPRKDGDDGSGAQPV